MKEHRRLEIFDCCAHLIILDANWIETYYGDLRADSSIAKAGLRSYISNLKNELTQKNIFVGHISLGILLKAGTGGLDDPESVAKLWYEKYSGNRYGEEVYPKGVTPQTVIR